MAILWTEDLSTGLQEIDNQHKELFDRINILLNACYRGKGKEEVGRTIAFLEDYIKTHFNSEEKSMIAHRYPGYEIHKSEHRRFIKNFSGIKDQFDREGPGIHIVILTNHTVIDWFMNHIRTLDKSFGDFLRK